MSSKLDLSQEFIGRRALVTGGSRGIGAAIVQRLLDGGATVVVAARTRSDVTPAAATFISGDLRTSEGVQAIAAQALAALGGLDILVNNAGGSRAFSTGGSEAIPDDEWQDAFALNLFSAVRLTNAVLPALRASKAAALVNISSTAATMPAATFAHYCAAKAALETYSRALAVELAASGIRVNVVTPGPVATAGADDLRKRYTDEMGLPADAFVQQVPLGRVGTPDDVAEVVALLASDRGKWLTGVNYRVDGGQTAR
ncbi:oxidoreductase [Nannocystis pusilla]|uniref:SDR family oxidoreductase n=1 Tax=Nannocystis pusilla TaxID=889268 RepID=A0ABS7U654_9BACT|nr:oxidoreductase [Nannocystis pusilla]MBZ5715923.1 SDR family oxidoreductase [Nannocystis pusilla]